MAPGAVGTALPVRTEQRATSTGLTDSQSNLPPESTPTNPGGRLTSR